MVGDASLLVVGLGSSVEVGAGDLLSVGEAEAEEPSEPAAEEEPSARTSYWTTWRTLGLELVERVVRPTWLLYALSGTHRA